MKPKIEKTTLNQIFHSPLQSDFLARVIYYGVYRFSKRYLNFRSANRYLFQSTLILIFLLGAIIFLIGFRAFDVPEVHLTQDYSRPSQVYGKDSSGNPIHFANFSLSARKVVHIDPKRNYFHNKEDSKVITALLVSEDINYYHHFGIDFLGILRAFIANFLSGRIREGASTITQQVARLRFLEHERSYVRKLREMFLSFTLEAFYPKHKILEDYLNMVPLGHGTYGVGAAADFYFDKENYQELNWGESALIAALTTRPREFSPILNPKQSILKVKNIFHKFIRNNQITITEAELAYADLFNNYYLTLNRSPNDTAFHKRLNLYPYATAAVYNKLPKRFKKGYQLYRNGYKIYTTINPVYQQAAQETVIPYLQDLNKKKYRNLFTNIALFDQEFEELNKMTYELFPVNIFQNRQKKHERDFTREFSYIFREELHLINLTTGNSNLSKAIEYKLQNERILDSLQNIEGGLISIIPQSGEIAAVIGGSGYTSGNRQLRFWNVKRQSGSAFKPLVVASALELTQSNIEKGLLPITAASLFEDTPLHFLNEDLSEYSPENYSKEYEGKMTLRRALTRSKNSIAIQVYQKAGPKAVNQILEKILGLDANSLNEDFTIPLGTIGVSPLQMARAFAIFATGGYFYEPYLIEKITLANDDNTILYQASPPPARRVLNADTCEIITSMLSSVISSGTGRLAALSGRDTAGKTGTTNNNTDTWFAGYVQNLVTVLYLGYDRPISMGAGATGGSFAAPLWGRYMYRALRNQANRRFHFPDSSIVEVDICSETGFLLGDYCQEKITEKFVSGTEPKTSLSIEQLNPLKQELQDPGKSFFDLEDIE